MLDLLADCASSWPTVVLISEMWHLCFVQCLQLPYLVNNLDQVVQLFDFQVLNYTLSSLFQSFLKLYSLQVEANLKFVKLLLVFDVFLEDSLL